MDARSLTRALGGQWRGDQGVASCPVPGHGRGRGDLNASLSIATGERQAVVVKCHAGCSQRDVIDALRGLGVWPTNDRLARSGGRSERVCVRNAPAVARSTVAPDLWARGGPVAGTLAAAYLARRGLGVASSALRFVADARRRCDGTAPRPAMIAALGDLARPVTAVQLTFLTQNGEKAADATPGRITLGEIADRAVELAPVTDELGLAEGVETALSAAALFGVPVWAACGARLQGVTISPSVERLTLFADHDWPGERTALSAARTHRARGLRVKILQPVVDGLDWNDVLMADLPNGS